VPLADSSNVHLVLLQCRTNQKIQDLAFKVFLSFPNVLIGNPFPQAIHQVVLSFRLTISSERGIGRPEPIARMHIWYCSGIHQIKTRRNLSLSYLFTPPQERGEQGGIPLPLQHPPEYGHDMRAVPVPRKGPSPACGIIRSAEPFDVRRSAAKDEIEARIHALPDERLRRRVGL